MTVLTRRQPFREVTSLQERVNQLFNDVFSDIDSPDRSSLNSFPFAPRTDVYEEDDRIVLEMEVPGMREEDVFRVAREQKKSFAKRNKRYLTFTPGWLGSHGSLCRDKNKGRCCDTQRHDRSGGPRR
jgi:hypothetical protein